VVEEGRQRGCRDALLVASFKVDLLPDNAQKCVDIVLKNGSKLGASHQAWQMNEVNALIWPLVHGIGLLDRGSWCRRPRSRPSTGS